MGPAGADGGDEGVAVASRVSELTSSWLELSLEIT